MKKLPFITTAIWLIVMTDVVSYGQNYKQPIPSVDSKGKVTDKDGKHIGWVTSQGLIKNAAGIKIAHINASGEVIDTKTGKSIGKAERTATLSIISILRSN